MSEAKTVQSRGGWLEGGEWEGRLWDGEMKRIRDALRKRIGFFMPCLESLRDWTTCQASRFIELVP